MRQIILEEQLRKKIMELKQKEKTLFVLKGIPVSCLDLVDGKMNLEALVNDKFGYFGNVIKTRNYMSYEEFLLLADFAVALYKTISNRRMLFERSSKRAPIAFSGIGKRGK